VKGERERALKKSLQASYDRIEAMMKKREKVIFTFLFLSFKI